MSFETIGSALANPDRNIVFDGGDILTSGGYTVVPNFLLDNSKVSAGAKLVYVMLLKYAWNNNSCFPGQARLAQDLGVGRTYTNACIQELKEAGLISITRRGLTKTNIYTLHLRVKKGRKQ